MMGMPWGYQELQGKTVGSIVEELRHDARDGFFDIRSWDHNSPTYREGRSNKQLHIAGCMVLGNRDASWEEARDAMLKLAFP